MQAGLHTACPDFRMDVGDLHPTILAAFSKGTRVLSIARHGDTHWSIGVKVDTDLNGKRKSYFLKFLEGDTGVAMALGEFESQTALAKYIPENIACPIAHGPYEEAGNKKAFYLTEFRTLAPCNSPTVELLPILRKLHQSSVSPNGKYGFHVTTFYGPPPMVNEWCDSWVEFFTRQFRRCFKFLCDALQDGADSELVAMVDEVVAKVIPRLLGRLEQDGRRVKPVLCHGDIWLGNVACEKDTGQIVLFDSCCFYGHNEMELQGVLNERYAFEPGFLDEYVKQVGISEPVAEFAARNAIYAIRCEFTAIANRLEQLHTLMPLLKDQMRGLIHDYARPG